MVKTMTSSPKKLPRILTAWLNKSFLTKLISVGKYVIWVTSLSLRSVEKAWPSVLYETVKFGVFVKENVFCRAVSSLVVPVDWKGHAVNFLKNQTYIWQTLLKKIKLWAMSIGCAVKKTGMKLCNLNKLKNDLKITEMWQKDKALQFS